MLLPDKVVPAVKEAHNIDLIPVDSARYRLHTMFLEHPKKELIGKQIDSTLTIEKYFATVQNMRYNTSLQS